MDRLKMNQDHKTLKALMTELGLSYQDIAHITGHSYRSVKSMLRPSAEVPRWVLLTLYVYRMQKLLK